VHTRKTSRPRRRSGRRSVKEDAKPATPDAKQDVSIPAEPQADPVVVTAPPANGHQYDPDALASGSPSSAVAVAVPAKATATATAPTEAARRPRRRGRRGGRGRRKTKKPVAAQQAEPAPTAPAAGGDGKTAPPKAAFTHTVPLESAGPEKPPEARVSRRTVRAAAPDKLPSDSLSMLINVADADECRIAITRSTQLQELYMERAGAGSHVGNIYKGVVTNVEPSIQAAFVDFGMSRSGKNGFLHISDLHPRYFPDYRGKGEEVGRKTPRRDRPPIQKCLHRGKEVLVQITKEGIGTKGPTLTTYLSLPGRYLVMMPGMDRLGVSRKIEDEQIRSLLRSLLGELKLPPNMGFIVRTAGIDRPKRDLQQDLSYLTRLWKAVEKRIQNVKAPTELYRESDLVIRTIRDVYSLEIQQILVDDAATAARVADFLAIANPKSTDIVLHYNGRAPLFHQYGIEEEIRKINDRVVGLGRGGSLVIDSTEALVAIDVNSGRFRTPSDAEETAYKINLEAAGEIARQLRLRDLGGVIICDFIDMRSEKHRREVERALREALKEHKERAKVLRMSRFGIIELTRQRSRPSVQRSIFQDCPHCRGSGLIKTPESMALEVMRLLQLAAHREGIQRIQVYVAPQIGDHLINRRRRTISALEDESGRRVEIHSDHRFGLEQMRFLCTDARSRVVPFPEAAEGGVNGEGAPAPWLSPRPPSS
jgi:ribonuclease E